MWTEVFKHTSTAIATLSVVGSVFWFVAQPRAEQFIVETVAQQSYASKYQVDEVNRIAIENLKILKENSKTGVQLQTRQEKILEELRDQRSLNNQILLELRSRQ